MTNEKKIAVIGNGSWATAIIKILCNNANKVNWYFRNQEVSTSFAGFATPTALNYQS